MCSAEAQAFNRIFTVRAGDTACVMGDVLAKTYGLNPNGNQTVLSITNNYSHEQTWFNKIRSNKPQNFTQVPKLDDPLDGGKRCDFCQWEQYTAADTFGRIEYPDVVSASNLFKYCEPCHGLLLFKHHHPLQFSSNQVEQLLCAASDWFQESKQQNSCGKYPFFLWNCLARAGASQFHGHAQIMLSEVTFPSQIKLDETVEKYRQEHDLNYWSDLIDAHNVVGLLTELSNQDQKSLCFPYLCPTKDMEMFILGGSLSDKSFAKSIYLALRTLIDVVGIQTFNVGIQNLDLEGNDFKEKPILARIVSRGKLSSAASDFGGLEVFGGASIGHMDPVKLAAHLRDNLQNIQLQ
eukprot:TRINITY_DN6865_c0_g2_i1.p1 TRINITY_DN6865_c0_g2~~TRINITY_DN6865_c0_g2_i1.p1  ORF type:complete len:380 (+),score=24.90 TRINITY_DN6865_c0_g2_i1:93-1142(+)